MTGNFPLRNSQKSPPESGDLREVLKNLEQSGDVILPATTNAVGLVEKVNRGCRTLSRRTNQWPTAIALDVLVVFLVSAGAVGSRFDRVRSSFPERREAETDRHNWARR